MIPIGPDRADALDMDPEGDLVLGSITRRKIGRRWSATIHSAEGFITFESDSAEDALNHAMMASFLFAPLPSVD
jgi:hypothetical protein